MPSNLPQTGTVEYNSVSFGTPVRSKITAKPVLDRAGRVVIFTEYAIEIRSYIFGNDPDSDDKTTNTAMAAIRQALTVSCGELKVTGTGFGDLWVNGASGMRDIGYGPRPELLSWNPIGNSQAALIEWRCTTRIPSGCLSPRTQNTALAFNYESSFGVDEHGMVTRTLSGYFEIAVTGNGPNDQTVPDAADQWRERMLAIAVPPGFRRISQNFHESADKRTMDFQIVDKQMAPGALPKYCTAARGRHSVRSMQQSTTGQWLGQLSATYTVSVLEPKSRAWESFMLLVSDRLQQVRRSPAGASLIFHSFEADEGLYEDNQQMSFTLGFTVITSLLDIFRTMGIWKPVPGTDFNEWQASVSGLFGVRGSVPLGTYGGDDKIVSVCNPAASVVLRTAGAPGPQTATLRTFDLGATVPAEASWLAYKAAIETDVEPQIAHLKTMIDLPLGGGGSGSDFSGQIAAIRPIGDVDALGDLANGQEPGIGVDMSGGATLRSTAQLPGRGGDFSLTNDDIQVRTGTTYRFRLIGHALRAGYPVPAPQVTQINGLPVVPERQKFRQEIVANWGGVPIVGAWWDFTYLAPLGFGNGGIPFPGNPATGLGQN